MHYKKLLDPTVFIGAQDFADGEKTVQIAKVQREQMPDKGDGDKNQAPMMYFTYNGKDLPRKYKVPKSVLYGLSCVYGTETDAWIGKDVTLFAAKCLSFGEIEECVRVRFTPDVEQKIYKWLKKRKSSPKVYIIREGE